MFVQANWPFRSKTSVRIGAQALSGATRFVEDRILKYSPGMPFVPLKVNLPPEMPMSVKTGFDSCPEPNSERIS